MTSSDPGDFAADSAPGGPRPPQSRGDLAALVDSALGLLAQAPMQPRVVRVRAGDVSLELEWPDPVVAPVPVAPAAAPVAAAADGEAPATFLTATTVGAFYRAPAPGEAPFVDVGDVVGKGQQVGIIEAMKLMIPVEADRAGRITEAVAEDGALVEFGDPLFAIDPDDEA